MEFWITSSGRASGIGASGAAGIMDRTASRSFAANCSSVSSGLMIACLFERLSSMPAVRVTGVRCTARILRSRERAKFSSWWQFSDLAELPVRK